MAEEDLAPVERRSVAVIALELRKWREEADLSQAEAAEKAQKVYGRGYGQSMLSRLENADREIEKRHIRDLGKLYGREERDIEELVRQLDEPDSDGILVSHGDIVPGFASDYFADEQGGASALDVYHGAYVFGLHQQPAYVRSARAEVDPDLTEADLDRSEALRVDRQKCLEGDRPPLLNVIYDEGVLHRRIGGPAVMRDQLDRLITEADRPKHTLRIVPLAAGAYPLMGQDFTVVKFDRQPGRTYVYSEHGQSATYHIRARAAFYSTRFDQIARRALSPEMSRELLIRLRDDLWKQ